jgi:membrane protease YdiL (CAAX protease family)
VAAWVVILTVIALILWRHQRAEQNAEDEDAGDELQERLAVGLPAPFRRDMYQALRANQGQMSWLQRIRLVVIAGEVQGPEKALEELDRARQEVGDKGREPILAPILHKLYTHYQDGDWSGGLTDSEREQLRQRLGWWGDLAVTPAEGSDPQQRQAVLAPAKRAAMTFMVYLAFLFLLGFIGMVLLVVMGILWLLGSVGGGLQTGTTHGGLYAETFAVYMVLFILLGLLLGRVFSADEEWGPLRNGIAALASLVALGWPVLRGIPWREVRGEIGWTTGRRPGLEPLIGVGTYVAAVPLVMLGVLLFFLITLIERRYGIPPQRPSHPIIGWVVRSGWWTRVQLIIVACIIAPLVEETMFRGVLYRHLREASSKFHSVVSVLASAVVSSIVFAIIHPQGITFVPVLGALAFTFALAREWRVTLIPSMVAHGITNGLAMLVLLLSMG